MYSFNSTPTTPAASPVRTTNTNTTNSNTNSTHQHPKPTTLVVEMGIDGMTCSMCSNAVSAAVLAIPGVQSVDISLTTDTAVVVFIPDATTTIQGSNTNNSNNEPMVDRLVHAIEAIGYDVSNVNVAPNNNTDTDNTRPTYNTNTNSNNNNTDPDGVAQRWQQYRQRQSDKVQQRRAAVLWAAAGTLPILILTMILPHFAAFHSAWLHRPVRLPFWQDKTMDLESLIVWILATPVQFVCGWDFYKMAWYGFINQRAGMDLLVALGTTASYGYALNGAWNSSNDDDGNNSNSSNNNTTAAHFFETSAILILFVLIGKWMQAVVVRQTSEALTQLMQLQCPTAIKITRHRIGGNDKAQHRKETPFNPLVDAYQEQVVDIQLVSAGDIVKIIRGASIPADGRILCGEIAVDESMMTGESLPVLKTNGSIVLGGTICVEGDNSSESSTGAAFVQVTGVGSSTALAQIVQLVQQAQTRAVPIQSFADQVSAIFVPTVCLISLLTYLVW